MILQFVGCIAIGLLHLADHKWAVEQPVTRVGVGHHATRTDIRTETEPELASRTSPRSAWFPTLVGVLGLELGSLDDLHDIVTVGLGGPQTQQTELAALFGGGTVLQTTGGISAKLAGLCALVGGSQLHQVTLNAMQVLEDEYN